MLKFSKNKLGILGVSSLILLFGCNGGGSSDSAATASIDTPFVSASCDGSRAIGSSCGSDASTAFFSVYPGSSSSRTAKDLASGCESLKAAIENGDALGVPYLTSTSEVHCDSISHVCTANPTNIWYDSNGHAVAAIPTGNYTILVRFSNDASSTTFKPSDALLCKNTLLDSTSTADVTVETGADTTIDPDLHAIVRGTPSVDLHCQSNLTTKCNTLNLNHGQTTTALFLAGPTCAAITTQINTYGAITTAPSYTHVTSPAKAIDDLTCGLDRGWDDCDLGINSNENWTDTGGSAVNQISFGAYTVVSIMHANPAKAHRSAKDENQMSIGSNDVVECTTKTFAAPSRGSDINMSDSGPTNNVQNFTLPANVNLGTAHVGCTSAKCTTDLNSAQAQLLAFPSDITCSSLVTLLNNGESPHLQPLAVTGGTVSCDSKTSELCSYNASDWSNQVPAGTYTFVSIVDRFNDMEFTHGPRVGDLFQCKENVAVTGPVAKAQRTIPDYVLGDADVQTVTWKDRITPDLTFTCSSDGVAACGDNLTEHEPFFFTAYNLTCAELLTVATGSADVSIDAKFVGIGGQFPDRSPCPTPIVRGEVPQFSCSDEKAKDPVTCTLDVIPTRDMLYAKDLQVCDERPYTYFRDGGPITVAAVGDASTPGRAGGPFGSPSILFCKQYSAWNISTTALTLDNSSTTTISASSAKKLRSMVGNGPVLAR